MKKDNEQLIDELVARRLAALPPASAPAGSWETLRDRLDGHPDVTVREQLAGLATPDPRGWEALAEKLDTPLVGDAILAEKLNSLQPSPAPGGWGALLNKMDAHNAEAVDVIVGDKLARAAAGTPVGWAALAARLELIRDRRHRVMAGAVVELSLMLSLALLLLRFGPTTP